MKKYKTNELFRTDEDLYIFEAANVKEEELHEHDFIELVYIRDGKADEYVEDAHYEVKRGDLIFINCKCTHRFTPKENFRFVNVCFRPEVLGDDILNGLNILDIMHLTAFDELRRENGKGMFSFNLSERKEIESILDTMLTEYKGDSLYRLALLKNYTNILVLRILSKMQSSSQKLNTDSRAVFDELSAYIDANIGADLSLSELAKKCFYNPSYLSRTFKEHYGMTLTEYINRKKLELAEDLSKDGLLSLGEIAQRAGFSSSAALHRASRKVYGTEFHTVKK